MHTQDENRTLDDLIVKYLSDTLRDDELHELRIRIEASDEHKAHFIQMREAWFSSIGADTQNIYNENKAFEHFLKQTSVTKKNRDRKIIIRKILRYAAAVLLFMGVIAGAYYAGNEKVKGQFADMIIEAPPGSKTKIFLPDGTMVWLNAGSRISYSQGFGVDDRNLHLTGEGYFEVVHNPKLPFGVITDEIRIDVLGTKFNCRNFPDDPEAWVSLVDGKIGLTTRLGDSFYLLPDQKAVYHKKDGTVDITSVKANNAIQWTKGNLFFDEELLPGIIKELERSYGVKITIADTSLNSFRFYGNFDQSLSIEEVMRLLGSTNKLDYSIVDKEITLKAK